MPIALAAVVLIWSPIGDAMLGSWWGIGALYVAIAWMLWRYAWRALFRVPDEQGALRSVRLTHLRHTAIAVDENRWRLLVRRDRGVSALEGLDAIRALAQVTSNLNQQGATIMALPRPLALALEMAAHEETERLALQGEVAAIRLESKEAAGTAQAAEAL